MNNENWIDVKTQRPEYETKVRVKLDNVEETIGLINDNYQRTCWLTKGTGGMFWRSMVNRVTHWKPLSK